MFARCPSPATRLAGASITTLFRQPVFLDARYLPFIPLRLSPFAAGLFFLFFIIFFLYIHLTLHLALNLCQLCPTVLPQSTTAVYHLTSHSYASFLPVHLLRNALGTFRVSADLSARPSVASVNPASSPRRASLSGCHLEPAPPAPRPPAASLSFHSPL